MVKLETLLQISFLVFLQNIFAVIPKDIREVFYQNDPSAFFDLYRRLQRVDSPIVKPPFERSVTFHRNPTTCEEYNLEVLVLYSYGGSDLFQKCFHGDPSKCTFPDLLNELLTNFVLQAPRKFQDQFKRDHSNMQDFYLRLAEMLTVKSRTPRLRRYHIRYANSLDCQQSNEYLMRLCLKPTEDFLQKDFPIPKGIESSIHFVGRGMYWPKMLVFLVLFQLHGIPETEDVNEALKIYMINLAVPKVCKLLETFINFITTAEPEQATDLFSQKYFLDLLAADVRNDHLVAEKLANVIIILARMGLFDEESEDDRRQAIIVAKEALYLEALNENPKFKRG